MMDARWQRRLPRCPSLGGWVLCAAAVSGCAVGPDFARPEAPQVTGYTATALPAQTVASPVALGGAQRFVGGEIEAKWWQAFGSPRLNALVEQALQSSPTLEAAGATLRQAGQTYEARAGSTLYPQANARLGAQRQATNGAAMGLPGGERTFELYNASVAVSYDLDLAGGNRRALEALAAQVDYQRFQFEGARLALAGNVVTAAITQAQLAAQIEASEKILADQQEQLRITGQRLALGNASPGELHALQTQVEQTRAGIPPLRNRLEQTNHLLAVLASQPPGGGAMPQFALADFSLPAELPLRVPSELVRLRPDIQASEALLHAAAAQHGVAVSRLYPQITLSANLGSQALTSAGLFGGESLVWGLAGQLAQPLFNGGLRAEARAAEAGFNAAAANYRQTVLQALRNVADVLRALDNDAQALSAQAAAVSSSRAALQLSRQQYALGAASYPQVLIAQQQARQIQIGLIAVQAQRLVDSAVLYQAMGAGAAAVR